MRKAHPAASRIPPARSVRPTSSPVLGKVDLVELVDEPEDVGVEVVVVDVEVLGAEVVVVPLGDELVPAVAPPEFEPVVLPFELVPVTTTVPCMNV